MPAPPVPSVVPVPVLEPGAPTSLPPVVPVVVSLMTALVLPVKRRMPAVHASPLKVSVAVRTVPPDAVTSR